MHKVYLHSDAHSVIHTPVCVRSFPHPCYLFDQVDQAIVCVCRRLAVGKGAYYSHVRAEERPTSLADRAI